MEVQKLEKKDFKKLTGDFFYKYNDWYEKNITRSVIVLKEFLIQWAFHTKTDNVIVVIPLCDYDDENYLVLVSGYDEFRQIGKKIYDDRTSYSTNYVAKNHAKPEHMPIHEVEKMLLLIEKILKIYMDVHYPFDIFLHPEKSKF